MTQHEAWGSRCPGMHCYRNSLHALWLPGWARQHASALPPAPSLPGCPTADLRLAGMQQRWEAPWGWPAAVPYPDGSARRTWIPVWKGSPRFPPRCTLRQRSRCACGEATMPQVCIWSPTSTCTQRLAASPVPRLRTEVLSSSFWVPQQRKPCKTAACATSEHSQEALGDHGQELWISHRAPAPPPCSIPRQAGGRPTLPGQLLQLEEPIAGYAQAGSCKAAQ